MASVPHVSSTRYTILAAARRVLAREGYHGLTAREIAAEAGTNVALLNYYFGSKQNLLLAIFEEIDREKLERQRSTFADTAAPLSAKWRRAVEYYRQDLADGYVRIMQELYAVGYSDPSIGDRVRERMNEWRSLLEETASQHLCDLGIDIPPAYVASSVVSFWLGIEVQHLAGSTEDNGRFFEMLDWIGDWLEAREQQGSVGEAARLTKRGFGRSG